MGNVLPSRFPHEQSAAPSLLPDEFLKTDQFTVIHLAALQQVADCSGQAAAEFPTGVVFVYDTETIGDAKEVVKAYQQSSNLR